jgi:hypothetical protein
VHSCLCRQLLQAQLLPLLQAQLLPLQQARQVQHTGVRSLLRWPGTGAWAPGQQAAAQTTTR